jgi:hypothetical protein
VTSCSPVTRTEHGSFHVSQSLLGQTIVLLGGVPGSVSKRLDSYAQRTLRVILTGRDPESSSQGIMVGGRTGLSVAVSHRHVLASRLGWSPCLVYGFQGQAAMPLRLDDVRRVATEVARAEDDALDVVGVVTRSGGSGYTEVLISVSGGAPEEDSLISVGLDRQTSEDALRNRLRGKLRMAAGRR